MTTAIANALGAHVWPELKKMRPKCSRSGKYLTLAWQVGAAGKSTR